MKKIFASPYAILLAIFALALIVRLLGLFARPIWYDEAFTLLFAPKGLGAMIEGTFGAAGKAAEEHPLLYYTLLWGWMKAFGTSVAAARLFSITAGMVTVWLGYLLAKDFFGEKTARYAAIVLAISPFLVHYSQEIRMYALMAAFTTAATLAFWRGSRSGKWLWWALFAVCAAGAMYSHTLAVFYLVPMALIPLWRRRWRDLFATFAAGTAAIILYTPWLVNLPAQLAKIQANYWTEPPGAERIITSLLSFTVNLPLPGATLMAGVAITIILIALALMQTFSARRNLPEETRSAAWLLYLAFTPLALLFIVSQWRPVFIERALLPSGVMFSLWLGWALFGTPMPKPVRATAAGLLLAGALMGIGIHLTYAGFPYAPFSEIDAYIAENARPGDAIIHSNKLTALPAMYFAPGMSQVFIADPPNSGTDTLALSTQKVLGVASSPELATAAEGRERVWLVIFQKSIDEFQEAGYVTHPHIEWLDENFTLSEKKTFGEVLVYLYTK